MMDPDRARLEAEARKLGFGVVRVATAHPTPEMARYDDWLALGRHADMGYLQDQRDARADPRSMLASCRSVVVLAMDYGQPGPPDPGGLTGRVACYAWGRDYHNLLQQRLRRLKTALTEAWPGLVGWYGVDNKPMFERAWARAAGLGFIGKNACAILPGDTSMFFLGVLLLNRELSPDAPIPERCGRCQRCLDACPTQAFAGPYQVDARRCISYLTIEHDGPIPAPLRPGLGRWVFGCDDCQTPCPHVHLRRRTDPDFYPRNAWLSLPQLLYASDEALLTTFEGSPIRRATPHRLRRSAAIVLGNIGDPAARPALEHAARSADAALVEHAEWALERL